MNAIAECAFAPNPPMDPDASPVAYYKSFDKVSSFNEGASLNINENIDWQYDIPIGNGYAYGLEMYAEKAIGKTLFGANCTYSISDRRFEDLNIGRTFPFGLNRNHSFKFSFTYRLSDFSEFLLNWSYMTGNYYSQPINVTIDINGKPIVLFPEKNNAQYPAFHRMDVGFSFYNTYKWGRAKFFLGLYNAYNRNNPFYTGFCPGGFYTGGFCPGGLLSGGAYVQGAFVLVSLNETLGINARISKFRVRTLRCVKSYTMGLANC